MDITNDKVKVLLMAVDDDPVILKLISKALESFSEVIHSKYYEKSSEFLSSMSKDVDLVILDINMPDHDIYKVMGTIEKINPFALVTLLTSVRTKEVIDELKSKYNRIRSSIDKNLIISDQAVILNKEDPSWFVTLKESIKEDLELIKLIKN
jgi:CheY-like chemotaxis protein